MKSLNVFSYGTSCCVEIFKQSFAKRGITGERDMFHTISGEESRSWTRSTTRLSHLDSSPGSLTQLYFIDRGNPQNIKLICYIQFSFTLNNDLT